MYIQRLVVRNFRAVQHLDVKLQSGLTCLIGENNVGKTTILQAIRLALDANLPNSARQLSGEDFSTGIDFRQPQQILVAIEFADFKARVEEEALVSDWTIDNNVAGLCYRFRPKRSVRQAITDKLRAPDSLTIEDYDWELAGIGGKDPATINWDENLGSHARADRLGAFHITFLQALRDVEEDLRRTRYSPLTKLLDVAGLKEEQKTALLSQLRSANSEIRKSPIVQTLGKSIASSLERTVGDTFKFGVEIGVGDPTFTALTRSLTLLLSGRGLKEADPARNGLGLNNVLYISMLLEVFRQRTALPNVAGQLLLVEEPEAHLHPELQRIIFTGLQASGCQAIATTHSTHVTSLAPLRNIVVLTTTESGRTQSTVPCDGCQLSTHEEKDLERYLDATRSTLLFSRKVILVEGMSEVFLIPQLVKEVLGIDLQSEGVSIVAIHGTHFLSYAKLFKKNGIEKKCVIITDGDLRPSDSSVEADPDLEDDGEAEDGNPMLKQLEAMASPLLKTSHCVETFEIELASKGNLAMFAAAARQLGSSKVAKALDDASKQQHLTNEDLKAAQQSVLRSAKRHGKARFAQVAAQHVKLAKDVPEYIREAVEWVRQ